MKAGPFLVASLVVGAGAVWPTPPAEEYVFFLTGDSQGYLAPCGCSDPMVGGVRRRADAIRRLGVPQRNVILENSALIKTSSRQDELKLETFAQLHRELGGTAMNLGLAESLPGIGIANSMASLSGRRLTSLSVDPGKTLDIPSTIVKGPFLIGGASLHPTSIAANIGVQPRELKEAVAMLVREAGSKKLTPVLMLDGDRTVARSLAASYPSLGLIQYRSNGHPPKVVERAGKTVLATCGDGGKALVRLVWKAGKFQSYVAIDLDPGYKDSPEAARIYRTYLQRITQEELLEALPRRNTEKYLGTDACVKCHAESGKVWKASKHAIALKTLQREGHDRDPDCVGCHVVGLESVFGYRSLNETPDLGAVGCESCHGPGQAHGMDPKAKPMTKVGADSCISCHRVENSPKFDFPTYWAKIRHK